MDKNWFNLSVKETEEKLATDVENGLSLEQVEKVRAKFGFNELKEKNKKSFFIKFIEQFKDFMIIILIFAAVISGVVGYLQGEGITDSIIIFIVILINALIGAFQEDKAEKSLEALKKMSKFSAKVIRSGEIQVVSARELVPGDLVIFDTGDYIPADLRVIQSVNLKVQEASLTGESLPVEKNSITIENQKVGVGDRHNMLFSSGLVTYGRAKAIVVETGMNTEVGKIADMLTNAEETQTPLQEKLNKLGKTLGIVAIFICILIFVVGILYGKEPMEMFMTAVSLAVAAIPEGLTAVSTIVLAIGVQRMVKKQAIIKRLPAVETLGSASVICTDKTGTLTQNKMTVVKLFFNGELADLNNVNNNSFELEKLVYISMLCNDTKVAPDNTLTGDPTETALIDMGFSLNFNPSIFEQRPRINEIPFDSERKLMTTVNKKDGKYYVYTKGGIDEILKCCDKYLFHKEVKSDLGSYVKKIQECNSQMAAGALRVLAMAYKELDHEPSEEEMKSIENNLTFVGMVGMIDPPRDEVRVAIEKCKTAGIKTVMITGDHIETAVAIAKELKIMEEGDLAITGSALDELSDEELIRNVRKYAVYARVSPEHKVRIVKAWQANGEIVAMTGDGVNDAPALKNANIGCAMGIVGTDVSKEAADVILVDDNFSTIVSAVEEGRRIYDNILKAIQFLLSSNIGEIIVLFIAILIAPFLSSKFGVDINYIVPLLPIHILWVNLVTDSLPALALAVDPAQKDVMEKRSRSGNKSIFTKGMIWRISYQGFMIGIIALVAFIIGLATPDNLVEDVISFKGKTYAVSQVQNVSEMISNGAVLLSKAQVKVKIGQAMAFIALSLSELVHIFNIRNNKRSIFKTGIGGNKWLFGAVLLAAALVFVVILVPQLRQIFGIPVLPKQNIFETAILVISPIAIVEIFKLFKANGKN